RSLESDVLDRRVADRLDVVVPAAALEVVEAPLPLDEQVGGDEAAHGEAVARVPRLLDVHEQLTSRRPDVVGGEVRILVGGLGGGQLHPALALGALAGPAAALRGALSPPHLKLRQTPRDEPEQQPSRDQKQRAEAVAEDGDVDEQPDEDEE